MCSTESHSLVRSLETQCLVEDKYPWESIRLGGPATPRLKDSGTSGCACYHQSTREEPSVRRMCWNPTCASSRCQTSRVNTQEASRWLVVSSSWSHRAHSAFAEVRGSSDAPLSIGDRAAQARRRISQGGSFNLASVFGSEMCQWTTMYLW
jgi:hypothetical protein